MVKSWCPQWRWVHRFVRSTLLVGASANTEVVERWVQSRRRGIHLVSRGRWDTEVNGSGFTRITRRKGVKDSLTGRLRIEEENF